MDFESRQFISQSEANRSDKLQLVSFLRIASIIVAILATLNSVLLFVVNGFIFNYITLSYAILNIIVLLLGIYLFIWGTQQYSYLSGTEDEWGEETDNFPGRTALFLSISFAIAEFVALVLYLIGQNYIFGLYQASSEQSNQTKFDNYFRISMPFIAITTILIIIILVYIIHNLYQLTISQSTSRFNIYLLAVIIALTTWGCIYILNGLKIYSLLIIIDFVILIVVLVAVIANAWRFRGVFLILASIQVLLIPVLITYQAQFIRDYQSIDDNLVTNCQTVMNSISQAHIESNNCYSKYLYETHGCLDGSKKCPSTTCAPTSMVQMWDQKQEGGIAPLGCLNINCCRQTSNLFTQDYLQLIAFSLSSALFLFALILFEFHLSRKARGDKTLGRNIEMLFIVLFVGTIIFGFLLLTQNYPTVPIKSEVGFAELRAQKATKFTTLDSSTCQSIYELVSTRIELSSECKTVDNCPINKIDGDKKTTDLLFAIWVKGIKSFKRKEQTVYQTLAAAKYIWPTYDGNGKDFFALIGKLSDVQKYVDSLKICFGLDNTELTVHLYQNLVDFPIETTEPAKHLYLHNHFKNQHKVDTVPKGTDGAAEASTDTKGTDTTTPKGTGGAAEASTDTKGTDTTTPKGTDTTPKGTDTPKIQVPNCAEGKEKECTTCKEGFKKDNDLGCIFSGDLKRSADIQIPMFKSLKTVLTGFVVGVFDKEGNQDQSVVPLQDVEVSWRTSGEDKLISTKTSELGGFSLDITSFDVADFSNMQYQPTKGHLLASAKGFSNYTATQVIALSDELYLGTIQLKSNFIVPKTVAATTTKLVMEEVKHEVQIPNCPTGEYLDGEKNCQKSLCNNVSNCRFCDTSNNCLSCLNQFSLTKNAETNAWQCSPSNECDKPQLQNNCLKCELKEDKPKCVECDAFSDLQTSGECKKSLKICKPLIDNCALCTADNKCSVCDGEYKLENGLCKNIDVQAVFKHTFIKTTINAHDVTNSNTISNASLSLYLGNCGSIQNYGIGKTNQDGSYEFTELLKGEVYSVVAQHDDYSKNCYEFIDASIVRIPLSPKLKSGQTRIVLEWEKEANLNLLITFKPTTKDSCLVGFLNQYSTGVRHHNSKYKYDSITIEQMAISKYLIFVQNFGDRSKDIKTYQKKLVESNARIKYYIADLDEVAVTYSIPNDQTDPKIGTNEAYSTEWVAWLVSCIDSSRSEIPQSLVSQNGAWWTQSLGKWYGDAPQKGIENFPNSEICEI